MSIGLPSPMRGPERPEQDPLALHEVQEYFHGEHENYESFQEKMIEELSRMPGVLVQYHRQVQYPRYVRTFGLNNAPGAPMPTGYDRMIWRPDVGTDAHDTYFELSVMFPNIKSNQLPKDLDGHPVTPPEGQTRWDDIGLEFAVRDGSTRFYWLNSKGLIAYASAEDLMIIPNREPDERDLYMVNLPLNDPVAQAFGVSELKAFIEQSELKLQASSPEDQ